MDSSDDDDDRRAAAVDDSQLDADDDAMNALLEEEIAAAMQADSDELIGSGGGRAEEDDEAEVRKDGGRAVGGGRRAVNGGLLHVSDEAAVIGAHKRPMRDSEHIAAGEVDSDLEEARRDSGEQATSGSASRAAAPGTAPPAAALSASRRRNNRENYQRREQRRRQLELEQSRIRASLPTDDAVARYETFRRARLSHSTLKSLIQQCTGSNKVEGQLPAVLSAMGRVYVGVVVEEARRAMRAMGHSGNIRPMHLREAHRRLADRGDIIAQHCSDGRKRGIGVAGWQRNGQFFREIG